MGRVVLRPRSTPESALSVSECVPPAVYEVGGSPSSNSVVVPRRAASWSGSDSWVGFWGAPAPRQTSCELMQCSVHVQSARLQFWVPILLCTEQCCSHHSNEVGGVGRQSSDIGG